MQFPLSGMSLLYILVVLIEECNHLAAQAFLGRLEGAVRITGNDLLGRCPDNRIIEIVFCLDIRERILGGSHGRLARHSPQEGHGLSSGADVLRLEITIAVSCGNAPFDSPDDCLIVVFTILNITELAISGLGFG